MDNIRHSLEYGAGTAVSSKIFKNKVKGIITTTVDINDRSNRFLKNADYVDEVYDNLFDIKNQFDLIFCSHILPFVVDFQNVWTDLIGKLKKGGYIFIEQGNATKDYYMVDTHDYPKLFLFSSKSLTELASNSDLNIVDISSVGHNWTDFGIHKKSKEYIKNDNGMFLRSILQKS